MVLAPPLLRVSAVSLNKGKAVLKDVSCELERGEILVLLGRSGSGKSSLLRCLNRLETIDEGEIFLTGRNVSEIHSVDLRRKVGMVFQTPGLLPGTVRENIKMGPHLQNQSLDESECENLLQKVGLQKEFLGRSADSLSVGEQQRVALGQALANRPEILLLDEPTSALDPTAVLTVEHLIKSIHQELESGTIFVTHSVEQALRFNAETMVLMDGKILAKGNINELINLTTNITLQKFFQGKLDQENR